MDIIHDEPVIAIEEPKKPGINFNISPKLYQPKFQDAMSRSIYDWLTFIPEFRDAPPSTKVTFEFIKSKKVYGTCENDDHGFWIMELSTTNNKTYQDYVATIAHEMIHMVLQVKGDKEWDLHDGNFAYLRERIEKKLGWRIW